MLPLYLLTAAKNQPILVELKNGETINGQLVNCDSWMNLTLKDVIQSSPHGDEFLKISECYIKGIHIKYLRLPEQLMDQAKEQNLQNMEQRNRNNQKRRGQSSNPNANSNASANANSNNSNSAPQRQQ
ncbi:putative probable U6 snRNA-associated Sm-like protein LSm4 [[Candida] railenensis]|uniref:LSM complex subunit LSM4 n=1 Tax=[Candida] railenensis TaxID=45579 RepID=A0A9P0QLL2_9ASCO|nr:putative probable U6 snRNA-associated Sm-like protein LSm4 [[Candida] railenensis]